MPKLTKRLIDGAQYTGDGKSRCVEWDTEVRGFGLRIFPTGAKSFVLSYRAGAGKRMMSLGPYGVLTLDEARKRAKVELGKVLQGDDPLQARRQARSGERVKDLVKMYEQRELPHLKSHAETKRRIDKYIVPALGSKRVVDVVTADVAKLHHKIGAHAPSEANRVRTILHRLFQCATEWGFADDSKVNPVSRVRRFKEHSRERFAGEDELALLWRAIEAEEDAYVRAAIKLILFTGCRKNEVLTRRWRDVDLTRAELRLPDTKAGEPQVVALNPEAVAVLRELDRGVGNAPVFPRTTITKAWNRIRTRLWLEQNPEEATTLRAQAEKDVQKRSKHAAKGTEAVEARLLALAGKRAKEGDDRLTIHDLRRSVGSLMALHTAPTVVGKALRNPSAVAVYTRVGDDTARRALEDHGKRLAEIVNGRKGGA